MLHACNAVDATGKKRYPTLQVGARFKKTIRDSLDIFDAMAFPNLDLVATRFPARVKSDMPDSRPDVADVLYGIHRCAHGHGDELPSGFELIPYINNYTFRFYVERGKIRLPAAAILGLLAVAVFAPENADQQTAGDYYLSWGEHEFQLNDSWGAEDHLRRILNDADLPPKHTVDWGHFWDDWTPV